MSESTAHHPCTRSTGGFITDSVGDFVQEGDRLEKHITAHLNVKHPKYKEFAHEIGKLIDTYKKESGLITYREGL